MEKINSNLLSSIKQKLFGDPIFLAKTRLSIAKTVFIFVAFLYFSVYLFIIWWYQITIMNQILFFLYPLFAFSTIALLYNIIRYTITIYFEKTTRLTYVVFALLAIIYIVLLIAHIGLLPVILWLWDIFIWYWHEFLKLLPFTL